jgi:hypothetical protein
MLEDACLRFCRVLLTWIQHHRRHGAVLLEHYLCSYRVYMRCSVNSRKLYVGRMLVKNGFHWRATAEGWDCKSQPPAMLGSFHRHGTGASSAFLARG